ncbi:hypothetical protein RAS2_00510 [Phycisphaerae bacterium RAS2]|nr:hypothetical protein RAS2_00510 [Phycisphaerae bacterium RAS2]
MTHRRPLWITVFRWVAVLPASFVAAWLAYLLVVFGNRLTMLGYVDPDSFLARGFVALMSHMVLGAVIIYVACFVAPSNRPAVAAIMTALTLLLIGVAAYFAVLKPDYWALFGGVCAAAGTCVTGYSVHSGEITFKEDATRERLEDTE